MTKTGNLKNQIEMKREKNWRESGKHLKID